LAVTLPQVRLKGHTKGLAPTHKRLETWDLCGTKQEQYH